MTVVVLNKCSSKTEEMGEHIKSDLGKMINIVKNKFSQELKCFAKFHLHVTLVIQKLSQKNLSRLSRLLKKIRYVALYSKLHHNSPLFDDVNFNIQKVVKFFIITIIIILSSIKAHINKKANTQMTILKENRNMVPYNHWGHHMVP